MFPSVRNRRLARVPLKRHRSMASAAFLPDELIVEIISWLPVKHLIQFRCVSKFYKTLISDPYFVQMHLEKSARNPCLALMWQDDLMHEDCRIITLSVSWLLQNKYTTPFHSSTFDQWCVIGSCNGLLCLVDIQCPDYYYYLYFWNPATRTKSRNILITLSRNFKFSFGYDTLSKTYKVIAFIMERVNVTSVVKVLRMGDDSWKNIQGPFDAHDRKIGYDKIIISYLNLLFGAPIWKDKIIPLLILSYSSFIISILCFSWVRIMIE